MTFLATYSSGMLVGLILILLRIVRLVKVAHRQRIPYKVKNLVMISNHPSNKDPLLVAGLLFWAYLTNPKWTPVAIAKHTLYDHWALFWLRPFMIRVERGNKKSELAAFREMNRCLSEGRTVILFLEGGRTRKGTDFLYSPKGHRIRDPKDGAGVLVSKTGALVVPIWLETTGLIARMKIGNMLKFQPKESKEAINQAIINALFELADE